MKHCVFCGDNLCSKGPGGVNMASLIMVQLKWLDHIVKSKVACLSVHPSVSSVFGQKNYYKADCRYERLLKNSKLYKIGCGFAFFVCFSSLSSTSHALLFFKLRI